MHHFSSRFLIRIRRGSTSPAAQIAALVAALAFTGAAAQPQSVARLLVSRAELTAAATRAEAAADSGDQSQRAHSAMLAAGMRRRLRDGDLQVGDRVVVMIVSDAVHRDTAVVRADRTLQLQGLITIPLSGVLRSELQERVSAEILKYVKQQIEVTPLTRVAVLGAVARPGYFALASNIPLTDAIMTAGGPTGTADFARSTVRRGNLEFKSPGETSAAIARGLTLDQFGLAAGDELVVGQRHDFGPGVLLGMTGTLASLVTLFLAVHRR